MTRVLIAVDRTDQSVEAAEVAHRLFGDTAEYLVVNVAAGTDGAAWAGVYPIVPPVAAYPVVMPAATAMDAGDAGDAVDRAEDRAADVAERAKLPGAEVVGEVGDVAAAIVQAAVEHRVDVIVVGSHDRGWFSRLFSPSVANQVISDATVPVLVVR